MTTTTFENPMGTDGFEFVEYTAPDPEQLGALFEQLGFTAVASEPAKTPGVDSAAISTVGAGSRGTPYNILFILTDQERFFGSGELPEGFSLPAHERLAREGVTFANHTINSCVCTPSRSVLYTGQHIQHTRMFDNTNFPWITSMSTEIRTVGDMLRDAG